VLGASLRWIFEGLVPSERIVVVTNGTPDLDLGQVVREPETGLYLGSLRRRKGVGEALEAALIVLDERPDARFMFVGEWESSEFEAAMRARAVAANGRIEFLQVATGDDKHALLARAGYMLFAPVEPEGHPRVVLEAHAAGIPTVATDRGAIGETVVEGRTGFVLPEPVPEDLAERVLRLMRDPALRDRMGRAAREHYLTHLTQERADHRFAEWVRKVA
jgi:glycosyltransferase involved in cell wall biosynthesis